MILTIPPGLQRLADRLPGKIDHRRDTGLLQLLPWRHTNPGAEHRRDIGQQLQHAHHTGLLCRFITLAVPLTVTGDMPFTDQGWKVANTALLFIVLSETLRDLTARGLVTVNGSG